MNIEDMAVKNGEAVQRVTSVDVAAKKVRKFNVSNNKPTRRNYKVDWTFDFSNCTESQILELAAQSAVISYRKNFKNVVEGDIAGFAERDIDVMSDIVTVQKRGKTTVEKVAGLVGKLSAEDKAKLLAELVAE